MKGESDCIFSSINNPIFQDIVASMNKDEWKILDKNANRISSTNASEENGLLVLQEKFKEIAERRRFDVVIFSLVTVSYCICLYISVFIILFFFLIAFVLFLFLFLEYRELLIILL